MINSNFDFITHLQYKVKHLTERVETFESGQRYVTLRADYKRQLDAKDQEIRKAKQTIADADRRIAAERRNWLEVIEDLEKEHAKECLAQAREIQSLQEKLWEKEGVLAAAQEKIRERNAQVYSVLSELEEEKGRNQKLTAQINRDYENSSIPSSLKINRKKIENSREKTGKRPGGQPGHEGHGRKKLVPTHRIPIPAPEEYTANPMYRPTGKVITKQMINIRFQVIVDEYCTPEFRNRQTGQRVHATFPEGVINDVNYGGSIKATAFLLNSRYCVSTDKVRELFSELTDGQVQISTGMINGLCKAFSEKTQAERKEIFADLLLSPVMNTDFTTARLNGKNVQVMVCATPQRVMYFAREHKGHEGVKGTPVEEYQGILVHDHDITFYKYGRGHQECLAHPLRYLKDSISNEPHLTWNKKMLVLIQEIIHYHNGLDPDADPDLAQAKRFAKQYRKILTLAQKEYEYEPPTKYYIDGFNLYKRLDEYRDNHLLCLRDKRVPTTNNLSERLNRVFKKKQKQVMAFRSFDGLAMLCNCYSLIESFRLQEMNLYERSVCIFNR